MRCNFNLLIVMGALILPLIFIPLTVKPTFGALNTDRSNELFGVGEPLLWRSIGPTGEKLDVTKAFEIMNFLGVRKLREWVWRCLVFDGNGTINQTVVSMLKNIVAKAESKNITVMGMVSDFPSWMTGIQENNKIQYAVPERNLTEGSPYMIFLQKYEKSWETLARELPEIELWEIGNEYNLPQFLHPKGYNENDPITWFNYTETVDIVTDLLYYGSRGIKLGNPNARTVIGGIGPGGNGIADIAEFLDALYKNIESGRWPSTNPADFFEVACWHPYIGTQEPDEQNWIEPNKEVYNIMVSHDDVNKSVVFSEFGYSDEGTGLSEEQVAKYLNKTFVLAESALKPWLDTIYWFRLIDPDPNFDKNLNQCEYGFGLVKSPSENYTLKPAAYAYPEFQAPFLILALALISSLMTLWRRMDKKKAKIVSRVRSIGRE